MEKSIVLIVDGISAKTQAFTKKYISPDAEVIFSQGDAEVIEKYLPQAKVLVTSTKGVPPEMLAQAPNCIYIQKYGAGVNNIAIPEATQRGIPVGNVPGANARSVAEGTLSLIMAVYRQVVKGHNALAQEGKWLKTVLRDNNHELSGKTVGIIGFGNIGKNLRQLLTGFGCTVLYYDVFRPTPEMEKELDVSYREVDDLMKEADVVTLHCPLTPETRHLIDARRLALMKEDAILVNCARGGVVDEAALLEALSQGRILGAGVDTYEKEPIDQTHPFCSLSNVVLSPHNGGGTVEAVEKVVIGGTDNINAMLAAGKPACPQYIVNRKELGL